MFSGLLVARFFQGVGACTYPYLRLSLHPVSSMLYADQKWLATFSTMVGGVISDIYHAEERNTPMALFSAAALVGTGLAPLLAGAIVYHTTWRWIFYSHAIVLAAVVVVMYFFFDETRGSVILSRKAQAVNAYYDQLEAAGHHGVTVADEHTGEKLVKRLRWKVRSDEDRASLADMISQSCYRPFRRSPRALHDSRPLADQRDKCICIDMLFTEPVVFFFSVWISFSWAVLYLQFGSIPLVFETSHGFNIEQVGAVFTGMSSVSSQHPKPSRS